MNYQGKRKTCERSEAVERLERFERRLLPLREYKASLVAALEAGDMVTFKRLLDGYAVCDHGAQYIADSHSCHARMRGQIKTGGAVSMSRETAAVSGK